MMTVTMWIFSLTLCSLSLDPMPVDGGILTSANHKKWYLSSLPINWIQKLSSEHHFGNYVIVDRKVSKEFVLNYRLFP